MMLQRTCWLMLLTFSYGLGMSAETLAKEPGVVVEYPPRLPGGRTVLTATSDEFLSPPETLRDDVALAQEAPTVDFLYFPGQDYPGEPWSSWGDSLAVRGKYYSSIGDHRAPAGNAMVYEYDSNTQAFRKLLDLKELLQCPPGHYAPAKIHSRLDLGKDGWIYCSTHRGSPKSTNDQHHYLGDWIVRCHPGTGRAEILAHAPVSKHCLPASVLDPDRLIYYAGSAPGSDSQLKGIQFLAYDVTQKRILYLGADGPPRCLMFARSTGRVYFTPGSQDDSSLVRWDPSNPSELQKLKTVLGARAATEETQDRIIYTISSGQAKKDPSVWAFDTRTEEVRELGPSSVASQVYVASVDVEPNGRYLYYVPGAHGGGEKDGAAVVQYDTKTRRRKVLCTLHPYFQKTVGCTLKGTYSTAIDASGELLYVTWNASRGSKVWDCCVLTVIHIPASERPE